MLCYFTRKEECHSKALRHQDGTAPVPRKHWRSGSAPSKGFAAFGADFDAYAKEQGDRETERHKEGERQTERERERGRERPGGFMLRLLQSVSSIVSVILVRITPQCLGPGLSLTWNAPPDRTSAPADLTCQNWQFWSEKFSGYR